jgi:hypothetical protein
MGFKGAPPSPSFDAPRRAPPRAPAKTPAAPLATPPEDHDFPSAYEPALALARDAAPPALDSGLERLIDLVAARLGCPHEEILHLKSQALAERAEIESFCSHVFESRIRPAREIVDPLLAPAPEGEIAFWLESIHANALVRAPDCDALAPYRGQRLELFDPDRTPFATLANPPPLE